MNIFLDDTVFIPIFLYGFILSSYKFDNYKSKAKNISIKKIYIRSNLYKKISQVYKEYDAIIKGVFLARDLVWKPANILYPEKFALECKKLKTDR